MSVLKWLLRCTPGLSVFGLLILLELALKIVESEWLSFFYRPADRDVASPIASQTVFILYSIFLHLLALLFPLRLCASAYAATCAIKATHGKSKTLANRLPHFKDPGDKSVDIGYQSDAVKNAALVTMAIVVPSYKEEVHILESSLRVLASHELARSSYDVGDLWSRPRRCDELTGA